MTPEAIIYPAIAMFFLSFALLMRMGAMRYTGTSTRAVSIKYYQLYTEGMEPPHMRLMTRHVQNHFETPPWFFAAVIFTYATGQVSLVAVVLAWAYVALRVLHSFIHLGGNDVRRRFFVYGTSVWVVAAMWGRLLYCLLVSG